MNIYIYIYIYVDAHWRPSDHQRRVLIVFVSFLRTGFCAPTLAPDRASYILLQLQRTPAHQIARTCLTCACSNLLLAVDLRFAVQLSLYPSCRPRSLNSNFWRRCTLRCSSFAAWQCSVFRKRSPVMSGAVSVDFGGVQ